jgi:hypothetical protein
MRRALQSRDTDYLRTAIGKLCTLAAKTKVEAHHIDEFDRRFAAPNCFISAGIECFNLARQIRDERGLPIIVGLAFDLRWGNAPRGINFRTLPGFRRQLWSSPPELVLLHTAHRRKLSWIGKALSIDPKLFGVPDARVVLREWHYQSTDEYPRHLWLISFPRRPAKETKPIVQRRPHRETR